MRALVIAVSILFAASAASAEVRETERVWARVESVELQARLYRDDGATGALPVIIDVHGGAWVGGSRTDGAFYDRALAQAGFLVVAIDYRLGPAHKHPAASADVAAAVRWVRHNAGALNADGERIGLIGSSAGGHLALLAALEPNGATHRGTPILDAGERPTRPDEIDASVDYVIALWTPVDPLARYRYAQRANNEGLQRNSLAYFGSEAAMQDASAPRVVVSGEAEKLPPLMLVQAGLDGNVPAELTLDMLRAYQAGGGVVELSYFPAARHAFGHSQSPDADRMVEQVIAFARRYSSP